MLDSILFLFTASLIAGIVNGVAGGGGLIAFPSLLTLFYHSRQRKN
ncbi:MAG: hypothetical protein MJK14_13495 [Rivularia sp. ALOHA_DT_140]|nr:hypothetical protein [Rivularia sp. ALOHA_DT_140]